jgi:hypothetical protein
MRLAFAALALCSLLGGCTLYFGSHHGDDRVGDDDDDCNDQETPPALPRIDPSTGECGQFYGCTCSTGCSEPAIEPGGACDSSCSSLDETTCETTPGCHTEVGSEGDEAGIFLGCWSIWPLPETAGNSCDGLDALACAGADDCISNMVFDPSTGGFEFELCSQEPIFLPPGGLDPGACTGAIACDSNGPKCPDGTTAGIEDNCYTGYCIPNSECSAGDPGTCESQGGAMCNIAPPACPDGTEPGVSNGCWSGYCIPTQDCL